MKRDHRGDIAAIKSDVAWLYQFIESEEQRLHDNYIVKGQRSRFPLGAGILRKAGRHAELIVQNIELRLRGEADG